MLRNNADARRYSYFLGLPACCKCYSLRAQSIKAKREYLILSCQSLLLIRLKNITKYLKNKRTINSFIIFSVFSGMRPCSLGTRERSIFGTQTLAPTFRAEKRSAQSSAHPLSQAQGGLFCVLTVLTVFDSLFVCH